VRQAAFDDGEGVADRLHLLGVIVVDAHAERLSSSITNSHLDRLSTPRSSTRFISGCSVSSCRPDREARIDRVRV
jgi:hypothetical protein